MPLRHCCPALGRKILEHAGVLQDEGHLGQRCRRARRRPASGRRTPGGRTTSRSRQDARRSSARSDRAPRSGLSREPILRVLVPLQLHAQAAHAGIFAQPVELRPHVARPENRRSRRWPAEIRSHRRLAARRRLRPRTRSFGPVGLHVDGVGRRRCRRDRPNIRRSDSRAGSPRRGRRCAAALGRRATEDRRRRQMW